MKKFITALALSVLPFIAFAQNEAFTKFENKEGISVIVISEDMINLLGNIVYAEQKDDKKEDIKNYVDKIKNIDVLRAFVTSDKKHVKNMKSSVKSYLKKNSLEEILSMNEKDKSIKFYIKQGSNPGDIKELLVFTENLVEQEVALISFVGDINLNDKNITAQKDSTN